MTLIDNDILMQGLNGLTSRGRSVGGRRARISASGCKIWNLDGGGNKVGTLEYFPSLLLKVNDVQ
jgi:hypothetical protein